MQYSSQRPAKFYTDHKNAYALIRIFLGTALFIRGWLLLVNPGAILDLLGGDNSMHMWFSYITIVHLVGGLLMTIGFSTRIGALIQIPILASAVFVTHSQIGFMMGGQSLELELLVLFLLVIFLVYGSGPISLKWYLRAKRAGVAHA